MRKSILYLSLAMVFSFALVLSSNASVIAETIDGGGDSSSESIELGGVDIGGDESSSETIELGEGGVNVEGDGSSSETMDLGDGSTALDDSGTIMSMEIISNNLIVEGDVVADGIIEAASGNFANKLMAEDITVKGKATLKGDTKLDGIVSQSYIQVNAIANKLTYIPLKTSRVFLNCAPYGLWDSQCNVVLPDLENPNGQSLTLTCSALTSPRTCKIYPPKNASMIAPGNKSPYETTLLLERGESATFYATPAMFGGSEMTWVLESRTN